MLNLGYNIIEVIPSFALSSRLLLRTLILRNNNISQLDGRCRVGMAFVDACLYVVCIKPTSVANKRQSLGMLMKTYDMLLLNPIFIVNVVCSDGK